MIAIDALKSRVFRGLAMAFVMSSMLAVPHQAHAIEAKSLVLNFMKDGQPTAETVELLVIEDEITVFQNRPGYPMKTLPLETFMTNIERAERTLQRETGNSNAIDRAQFSVFVGLIGGTVGTLAAAYGLHMFDALTPDLLKIALGVSSAGTGLVCWKWSARSGDVIPAQHACVSDVSAALSDLRTGVASSANLTLNVPYRQFEFLLNWIVEKNAKADQYSAIFSKF